MKIDRQRLAPFGLVISGVAAGAALLLFFIQREWNLYLQICMALVVIGLALFAILDPDRVLRMMRGRQARHGSNALVLTAAFIGIVVVINFLVFQYPVRTDLTEDKQNTLAVETLETLDKLDSEVIAVAYFTNRLPSQEAYDLLERYRFYSNEKFDFEFIDPEINPVAAEQDKITRDGTIVLKMGDQHEAVSFVSEQELTGALVRLLNPEQRKVYFLRGHGEYDPDTSGERGYSQVKLTLESKNYSVDKLMLLTTDQIPADAKVLVIAGPQDPVTDVEIDRIREYLNAGGAVLVMLEPLPVINFTGQSDPLVEFLEEEWGITAGEDIVIDLNSMQPFAPFADEYAQHVITSKLESISSQFPTARSVRVNVDETEISRVELVKTGQQSWAETDLDSVADDPEGASFVEQDDVPGPVALAVVAEDFSLESKVAAYGDSDFASDSNYFAYANGDLLINTIDWLAGQENLINLTPKPVTQRSVVPIQPMTANIILLVTVIIIPGLALLMGFFSWYSRRRRG